MNVIDPARVADLDVNHPDSARSLRGSGYRVLPGAVLTAAHVVSGASSVTVRFNADRSNEWSVASTEWWVDGDVAVLVITPRTEDTSLPATRFGRLPDRSHVFRAETVGFPLWKLRDHPGVYRDSHHAYGEIAGLSNRREGTLELTVGAPADDPDATVSPWEGMSGAAVWVSGRIVGVVSKHYRTDGLGRLAVCRIDTCRDRRVRTLLGLADVPDVHLPTPVELAADAYLAQVDGLLPRALLGRDDELAVLARFCQDDVPYAWWQAEPWAGKTALMSRFATDPPPDCDVVSFFVTGRLLHQSDSDAFIDAMCIQLAALVGEPMTAPGPPHGVFRRLLREATTRARELRRRLVLLVDGLDEDTSREQHKPSIVSLLPIDRPPELGVLVTSRPGLPLDELDGDHPLRTCPIRQLATSPHAKDIGRRARAELDSVLTGTPVERDVLGYLTAAGGGVTSVDLATLLEVTTSEVDAVLAGMLGRCTTSQDGQLAFSHYALAETAQERLGPAVTRYRERLHRWAVEYREHAWPADTPRYLLHGYPRLLAATGDRAALVALATDRRRHDLMFEVTGSDGPARTEIRTAQDMIRDDPAPDLATLLTLAIRENDLAVRSELPAEAPAAWASLGHVDRAEAIIGGFAHEGRRVQCLAEVATVVTAAGEPGRASALADQAETIVSGLDNHDRRAGSTAMLALEAAERGDHRRADRLARAVEPLIDQLPNKGMRAVCWVVLAKAAAKAGDRTRAQNLAKRSEDVAGTIDDPSLRLRGRAEHAAAVLALGDVDRAQALLREVETEIYDLEEGQDRGWALARLVAVHADAGDLGRADSLARELVSEHYRAEAWKALVGAFARVGEYEQARILADEIPLDGYRASAFAVLARIEAGYHDRAEDDLARAVELAREANRFAVTRAVATALAGAGLEEQALLLADTLPTPETRNSLLADLADRYEQSGDVRRAAAAINRISSPDRRKLQTVAMLTVQARKHWLRWYRRDRKKACDTALDISNHRDAAYAFSFIAGISAKLQDPDWYETFMDHAEQRVSRIDYPDTRASVLRMLILVAAGVGDESRATALNERRDAIVSQITSVETRESLMHVDIEAALAAQDWEGAEEIIRQIEVISDYRDDGLLKLAQALAEHGEYDRAERVARDIDGSGARGAALIAVAEATTVEQAHRLTAEALTTSAWPKTVTLLQRLAPETLDLIVAAYPPSAGSVGTRVRSVPWALVRQQRADEKAEQDWRTAAEAGDVEAKTELGKLLMDSDTREAEHWLRAAAETGDARAMSLLALTLGAENAEAWEWGRRAVESNDPRAMFNFALLHEDVIEAEQWYRAAAQAGLAPAMVFLGDLLTDRGDETEAEQWYRKAADNGDLDGICRFGACLAERGETAEAETLLRTAAEQGHVEAMFTLGVLYETDMDKKAESVRWYINAAERGAPVAMYFLGLHFEELGNLDEARNWLRDAADAGQPDAATRLSALLS